MATARVIAVCFVGTGETSHYLSLGQRLWGTGTDQRNQKEQGTSIMNFGQIFERRIKRRAGTLGVKRRTLNIELLEDRRLLAFTATLVDDLTVGPNNTFDPDFGTTDGGTDELLAVGDDLFFRSRKLFSANDLYVVGNDPIPATPTKLSTQGGFNPTSVDGSVFFYEDIVVNTTLWQTDGTLGGTSQVLDIDDTFSFTLQSAEVNGKLIFVNADATNGVELWVFDPSGSAPTGPLLDIHAGADSAKPVFHGTAGDKLFFTAQTGAATFGLFATDGTVAGTEEILPTIGGAIEFNNFVEWNGEIAFLAQTEDGNSVGDTLYRTDGTAAGTSQIVTPTLVDDSSSPGNANQSSLVALGANLYFTAANELGGGFEIWKFDGTDAVQLTNDLFAKAPSNLILFDGDVFFTADEGVSGFGLWRSALLVSGNATSITSLDNSGPLAPSFLTPFAGNLFFVGDSNDGTGKEVRYFDPTDSSVNVIDTIVPGSDSASPRSLTVVGNKLFFTADDAANGRELWAVNEFGGEIDVRLADDTLVDDGGGPIDFGIVSTTAATATQTFTIHNRGIDPLNLTGPNPVSISGTHASNFTVTIQPSSLVIAPGGSTTFTVEFDPSAGGLRTATVSIANDDPDESPFDFTIEGTGLVETPADIQISGNGQDINHNDFTPETADGTDFGDSVVGEQLVHIFTITNTGDDPLSLTGPNPVSITGLNPGDYSVIGQPTDLLLTAGESTTFTVQFDAQAIGPRPAAVVIANNDADESPYIFAILGNGLEPGPADIVVLGNGVSIADGDITPSAPDHTSFGTVGLAQSVTREFTITNAGGDTLNLTGPEPITLTGTDVAEYTVFAQPAVLSLAPGESTTFQVQFTAAGLGVREATINIASDDLNENPFDFSIQSQVTPQLTNKWISQGPAPAANGQVENILPNNPVTGAIHTVLAHPVNPNILYIGAVNGGIWKTVNATATTPTWTPQTDFQASLAIGALTWDYSDSTNSTLVAGTGNYSSFSARVFNDIGGIRAGILRTTDGGQTWVNPGSNGLIDNANISGIAAEGDTIVVTSNTGGMYRSTDGGVNFSVVTGAGFSGGTVFFDLVHDSANNILYAGANKAGIVGSADFGATWTTISSPAINQLTDDPSNNNLEMAVHPITGRLYAAVLLGGKIIGSPLERSGTGEAVAPGAVFYAEDAVAAVTGGGTASWTEMGQPTIPLSPGTPIEDAQATEDEDGEATAPIIITSTGHGLFTGDLIYVFDVEGMTTANGLWRITVIDGNSFSLDSSDPIIPDSEPPEAQVYVDETGTWFRAVDSNPTVKTGLEPGSQARIHFSIAADPFSSDLVYLGGDRQEQGGAGFPNIIGADNFSGALFRGNTSIQPDPVTRTPLQWANITHDGVDIGVPFFNPGGTASSSAPHADSREMTFDALGNLIEVDDGGIYKRTLPQSGQGDWVSLIGNLQVSEIHDIAYDPISGTIITGTQDAGTQYQFTPDVSSWFSLSTGDGGDVAVDSLTLAGQNQSIRYSSFQNLGAFQRTTWDNQGNLISSAPIGLSPLPGSPNVVGQFSTPIQLNNVDPQQLLIGGSNGLFVSTDQGNTVTLLVPNLVATGSAAGNAIDFGGRNANGTPNIGVAYVGTNDGNVWVRSDANDVFVANQPGGFFGGAIRDVIMNTKDASEAFATDNDHVYMTSNFGQGWDDITGDLFTLIDSTGFGIEYFRSLEFMEGINDNSIVVGTNIGVFAMLTSAPGEWFEVGTDLPNAAVWDLDYDAKDDVLVVGTLGRGAWKLTGLGSDIGASVNTLLVTSMVDESDGNFLTGDLSLREAIELSNLTVGVQTITIDPSFDGETLLVSLGAIDITEPVIIDASKLGSFTLAADDPTPLQNNGDGSRLFNITDGNDAVSFDVELVGLTLTGGDVTGSGGAISSRENLTLTGLTFTGNHATTSGGALSHNQGSLTITNSLFENNSNGLGHGGAIAVANAQDSVLIEDTTVRFNSSLGDGGGVDFLGGAGNALINRSTINNNTATNRGAGVWADRPINIASTTISGNIAVNNGGGIWSNHSLSVSHSTITDNRTTGIGGGAFVEDSAFLAIFNHTIIAGNTAPSPRAPDLGIGPARTVDLDFSLLGDNTDTGLTETVGTPDANGNLIGGAGIAAIDALLGGLVDNGGSTQTHALQIGSPAIDIGDQTAVANGSSIPFTDQRGATFRRVADSTGGFNDRIDIGAYEFNPVAVGDFNRNQVVDLSDYTIWLDSLGSTSNLAADANTNGVIDQADYDQWKQHFGDAWTPPAAAVTSGAVAISSGGAISGSGETGESVAALVAEPEVSAAPQSAPELTGIVEVAALLEIEETPATTILSLDTPSAEPTESSELAFAQISVARVGQSPGRRDSFQSEATVDQDVTDAALLVLAVENVPTDPDDDVDFHLFVDDAFDSELSDGSKDDDWLSYLSLDQPVS